MLSSEQLTLIGAQGALAETAAGVVPMACRPHVFLRDWWYLGPLGEPHSLWALRLRTELGRLVPHSRR